MIVREPPNTKRRKVSTHGRCAWTAENCALWLLRQPLIRVYDLLAKWLGEKTRVLVPNGLCKVATLLVVPRTGCVHKPRKKCRKRQDGRNEPMAGPQALKKQVAESYLR